MPLEVYGVQHRGGKGKMGMTDLGRFDDIVQDLFVAKTHDDLLFFTNLGRIYSLNVFEVPEGSRIAKGRAVINLLPLVEGEKVVKLLPAHKLVGSLVMLTKHGLIKKTNAQAFKKIRTTGIRAITLREGDELVFCSLSSGEDTIVIATAKGQGIRFDEKEVRQMGRQAAGVRGIRLRPGDCVIGMEVVPNDTDILFVTENGYGKRVKSENFRIAHRGGLGVRTIPAGKRNGLVVGLAVVDDESNILLIDNAGKIIRLSPTEVRTMGRQAKGVRLIKLDKGQKVAAVGTFHEDDEEEDEAQESSTNGTPQVKADSYEDDYESLSFEGNNDEFETFIG